MDEFSAWPGAAFAVGSAILFGASTPLAKLLLSGGVDAQLLAGLFYLGSGVGLSVILIARTALSPRGRSAAAEARLRRTDLPPLCLAVLLGGAVAPVLMMSGLARISAASGALLQNLEGLATMGIAWVVFRENVDRRLLLGAFAILGAAALLSWQGQAHLHTGGLLIAGACLCWGIDSNLTRQLSSADPMRIAMLKGIVAGTVNGGLALWQGGAVPPPSILLAAGYIGFLGYGISLALFV